MTADAFWRLIEDVKQQAGDDQEKYHLLMIEKLSQLSYPDIGTFHAMFNFYLDLLDRPKIAHAATIVGGLMEEEGFYKFRHWVVSTGETVYKKALADPDSLADVAGEFAKYELIINIAGRGNQKKHRRDKEEYWLTYGKLEEYKLSEEQIADCQKGIVFAPDIDSEIFKRDSDVYDDRAALKAMRKKYFPRLFARFEYKATRI